MTKRRPKKPTPSQLEPCTGCGNSNPLYLGECPHCGSQKCDCCDLGDDVDCGNCSDDDIDPNYDEDDENEIDFNEDDGGP